MPRKAIDIKLLNTDINALSALASSPNDAELARRATVILECGNGKSNKEISEITGMNPMDVGRWRKTFADGGIDALKGKPRGGYNGRQVSDDSFDERLDNLLAQDQREWTMEELIQQLDSTENIVSAALRKREINLTRQRQWGYATQDELIAKTVDVVGLYITKEEQAMIICCSQELMLNCHGEFVTRNRMLSEDFLHYNGKFTLADAINTAVYHVKDTSKLVPVSLKDFLDRTISLLPDTDEYEYHILLHSTKTMYYRGEKIKNVYQNWANSPQEWLQLVYNKIEEHGDRARLNAVKDLHDALTQYLDKCIETTSPLIWRKTLFSNERADLAPMLEEHSDAMNTQRIERPDDFGGTATSAFLEEVREAFQKHLSPVITDADAIKCGFISFAFDQNDVRLHIDMDVGDMPKATNFDISTVDGCTSTLTLVEKSLVKTRNEAGVHAAESAVDLLKKKREVAG